MVEAAEIVSMTIPVLTCPGCGEKHCGCLCWCERLQGQHYTCCGCELHWKGEGGENGELRIANSEAEMCCGVKGGAAMIVAAVPVGLAAVGAGLIGVAMLAGRLMVSVV